MSASFHSTTERPVASLPVAKFYEDPMDEDSLADSAVPATRRGLTRLALIAAETGARFQREGVGKDPMAWLLAPRRLFGGETAIEAVLGREDFMRALLLHGLSLGLDAEPGFIDELVAEGNRRGGNDDDDEDFEADNGACHPLANGSGWFAKPRPVDMTWSHLSVLEDELRSSGSGVGQPRLYTATLVYEEGRSTLQAFHASVCMDPLEAYECLASRYGSEAASQAELAIGFDPTSTFAEALVSPAMSELLQLVESEPGGSLAAGLDLNLEQRFAA